MAQVQPLLWALTRQTPHTSQALPLLKVPAPGLMPEYPAHSHTARLHPGPSLPFPPTPDLLLSQLKSQITAAWHQLLSDPFPQYC